MPTFAPVERPLWEFDFEGSTVPVGAREVEEVLDEEALELLVLELDVLLLVLLRELEVVEDKVLLVEEEEGLVERDIVVGVDIITSVIPDITVVRPDNENSELTGTVANPVKMTSVTPLTTVTRPGTVPVVGS
jgi:hypothetical protein